MKYDFDQVIERRGTDSFKWQRYGDEVIPLWVADMDFISSEPIIKSMHERVDHGVFGYVRPSMELIGVIKERLQRLYKWEVQEEDVVFVPGVVTGLNLAFLLFADLGDSILVQPPVYSHFVTDPVNRGRTLANSPLIPIKDTYEIDFDAFENTLKVRKSKIFVLCNPHNPVGRVFRRDELEKLADICLRHNVLICADEIHCDLLYHGYQHIPIASLSNEVADRTITFMSPSKTFNVAGLKCSFAIIKNPSIRETWERGSAGLIPHVNIMGLTAALAALRDGQEWLNQCLSYLTGNRDFLIDYMAEKLPSLKMTKIEGTYLAWIDCRYSGIPGNPYLFFLKESMVALTDGIECGQGGDGFVRLNFACPRETLIHALENMGKALGRL